VQQKVHYNTTTEGSVFESPSRAKYETGNLEGNRTIRHLEEQDAQETHSQNFALHKYRR